MTFGYSLWTFSIPSGQETKLMNVIFYSSTPDSINLDIAIADVPLVPSIGSRRNTLLILAMSVGSLE